MTVGKRGRNRIKSRKCSVLKPLGCEEGNLWKVIKSYKLNHALLIWHLNMSLKTFLYRKKLSKFIRARTDKMSYKSK